MPRGDYFECETCGTRSDLPATHVGPWRDQPDGWYQVQWDTAEIESGDHSYRGATAYLCGALCLEAWAGNLKP